MFGEFADRFPHFGCNPERDLVVISGVGSAFHFMIPMNVTEASGFQVIAASNRTTKNRILDCNYCLINLWYT